MVKAFVPKTAFQIAHDCVLMMGHYGYSREHAMGQRMLDVLGYQIGDGTIEAQNLILVREILGKEFLPYRLGGNERREHGFKGNQIDRYVHSLALREAGGHWRLF